METYYLKITPLGGIELICRRCHHNVFVAMPHDIDEDQAGIPFDIFPRAAMKHDYERHTTS